MNAPCRSPAHVRSLKFRGSCGYRTGPLRTISISAVMAGLLAALPAHAARSASVKVRGAAQIAASARAGVASLEVRGTLTDDAGHPLGQAHLRMKLVDGSGKARELPAAEKCPPTLGIELARGYSSIGDAYIMETDATGGFCVRVAGEFERGKVELTFEDVRDLHERAELVIPIDTTRRTLSLSFTPQPVHLDLGQLRHVLVVDTKLKPPWGLSGDSEHIQLELLLQESKQPAKRVATANLQAGTRGQFDVRAPDLGRPGHARLTAVFRGTESIQPAEHSIVISRTAQVELSLAEPPSSMAWAPGTTVPVAVGSVSGAVPSGSVEARVMGRTVGIAPVQAGAAMLEIRVEASRRQEVTATLHYLPDTPWWLPGAPLQTTVTTVTPSGWVRWTWIVLAGLVAGWTFWAWHRPRRKAPTTPPRPVHPGRAQLEVVRSAKAQPGWRGHVIDAHDGVPIARAVLRILSPAFRESAVLQTALTTVDGAFSLDPIPAPWPEGVRMQISSAEHATLEQPLPAEGELVVHLTTRRRALLDRLMRWVARRGRPYAELSDPTPGQVAATADRHEEPGVSRWARAIETAAYGPVPPDANTEHSLLQAEPGREPEQDPHQGPG